MNANRVSEDARLAANLTYLVTRLDEMNAHVKALLTALLLVDPTGKFEDWEDGQGKPIGKRIASAIDKARASL